MDNNYYPPTRNEIALQIALQVPASVNGVKTAIAVKGESVILIRREFGYDVVELRHFTSRFISDIECIDALHAHNGPDRAWWEDRFAERY